METHTENRTFHYFWTLSFATILIFFTYIVAISTGWIFATIIFLYGVISALSKLPRVVVFVPFIVASIFFSTTIPKGSFVYNKNGAIEYNTETNYLVSPFIHRKPFESGPHPNAGYITGNNLPEGWLVSVEYWISDPTKLNIRDWLILKSMVKEGVDIPSNLFDVPSNQQKYIGEYFSKNFPFIKTNVEVRYKKQT